MKYYIKEMRIKHYVKNILVFIPLFFSRELFDFLQIKQAAVATIALCLACSFCYIINDILDVEKDRHHPEKSKRPIAAGKIPISNAIIFACVLLAISVALALTVNLITLIGCLAYVTLVLVYSKWLKHIVLLDVFSLAAGFIFRIYIGGFATSVAISEWLFLTFFCISLFLAFGKRRNELGGVDNHAETRTVLKHYNIAFINRSMTLVSALTLVFYSLWILNYGSTSSLQSFLLLLTVPMALFFFLYYQLIIDKEGSSGDPTDVLLGSKPILSLALIYGILLVVALYVV